MTTFLIILAIGFVITVGLIIYSMRTAPLDTSLWGPEAYIMNCDPQTRQEILQRHPELVKAILQYHATGSRSLPGELVAPQIEAEDTLYTDD